MYFIRHTFPRRIFIQVSSAFCLSDVINTAVERHCTPPPPPPPCRLDQTAECKKNIILCHVLRIRRFPCVFVCRARCRDRAYACTHGDTGTRPDESAGVSPSQLFIPYNIRSARPLRRVRTESRDKQLCRNVFLVHTPRRIRRRFPARIPPIRAPCSKRFYSARGDADINRRDVPHHTCVKSPRPT